ncbi:hypothetical protein GCM10010911_12670 [Paenibacillus nasutitermitis]|uniref:Uncharacterized protein n=1 Tax=Paenibacillus nasutitermitis TaxID=1652958 RepID=A0A917DPE0_9BACL|nr:hypothetical protein GCM10010911_12670 [Paenibacillus nasutitermitis]
MLREWRIDWNANVICIVSGAGYKDVDRMDTMVKQSPSIPMIDVDEL